MYSMITSGALLGVQATLVCVEADVSPGLPGFHMVGSLSCETREARERVMVTLKNLGLGLPPRHITVNLSPADIRKEGTAFDLPVAVGILAAMEYFPRKAVADTLFVGELGLNGEIKSARGVLPIVKEAAERGIRQCIVPRDNMLEGAVVPGMTVRGAGHMEELLAFLQNADSREKQEKILPAARVDVDSLFEGTKIQEGEDFSQVAGQEAAVRAAEIAAAGFHNLLLTGPPGAGKSMIARRIPGILPPLSRKESLEVTAVASVAGRMKPGEALVTKRPFCSPHHTISQTALIGGGSCPRPGAISLAHRGVLFLDELPEFSRQVIDSLRQPIEDRQVQISRVWGNVTYPCDFMLIGAMNPCPCGFYPDRNRCRCTKPKVQKYLGRLSGPVLDRFDLCVQLEPPEASDLLKGGRGESSREIGARVIEARKRQEERFAGSAYRFNGEIQNKDMEKYCSLGEEERRLMQELYGKLQLSARGYYRILRVARTIADLERAEQITAAHLMEAAFYRPSEEYWKGE